MRYFLRESPEKHGINSVDIIRFLNDVEVIKSNLHTFMLLKGGVVVAEGYRYPYEASQLRLLHSGSKTFTATAIGIAVREKLLDLEDNVISFFPEYDSCEMDRRFKNMTVKNLLTMSTGHSEDSISVITTKQNWVEEFIKMPLQYEPGEKFLYDSGATFMLSAILTRVTGVSLEKYLKTRLFEPLGITGYEWDHKDGITTGGWGLMLKPEDFAKLGVLFLGKGEFEGKRIFDPSWADMASSKQIDTSEIEVRDDWSKGYCFQMWRGSENTFRADGAFGQFCIIAPDKDIVAVITSEDGDSQELLSLFYSKVLSKAKDKMVFPDCSKQIELSRMLCNMSKPIVFDATSSYLEERLSGRKYLVGFDGMELEISFDFHNDRAQIAIGEKQVIDSSKVTFISGVMQCEIAPATFIEFFDNLNRSWRYSAHHSWVNYNTLLIDVYYTETAHSHQIEVIFDEDSIDMRIITSIRKYLEVNGITSARPIAYKDIRLHGSVVQ